MCYTNNFKEWKFWYFKGFPIPSFLFLICNCTDVALCLFSFRENRLPLYCKVGGVNFSEFEITVCGTVVAKCQKTKLTIFNLLKKFSVLQKSIIIFPPPYKKINYIFANVENCLKLIWGWGIRKWPSYFKI